MYKTNPLVHFDIRTDLAVEETEQRKNQGQTEFSGVTVKESFQCGGQIRITHVSIQNQEGAASLGKSQGNYITLDVATMKFNDGESHREISRVLADQLQQLMAPFLPQDEPAAVLVVGLGNANVTPDALGPSVLGNVLITRHLRTGQFQHPAFSTDSASVSGIIPGVMAQTGMETFEIIQALIPQVQPHVILVIDALAARSVTRLGTTIQVTDTGIHPGSGVGNHRHGLTQESLGVPIIAIGVPTVVGAAAIVTDTLDALLHALRQEQETSSLADALSHMDPEDTYALIRQLLEPRFGPMFVTPKDIDETVKRISFTVSEGINIALFGEGSLSDFPH